MAKKSYKKEEGGWIGEQFNDKHGNSIERLDYDPDSFDIFLASNRVRIGVGERDLRRLIELLREFEMEELRVGKR